MNRTSRSRRARGVSATVGSVGVLATAFLVGCGPSAPTGPAPVTQGANVLLIVVDTLRADHLGVYGSERNTSPQLDSWASEGCVFEHAWATAPWTLPSFASIYTGQLPSRHGAGHRVGENNDFSAIDPSLPTLAEILQEQGYATGAIANNPFLDPEFGLRRGFDEYDYNPADNRTLRAADEVVDLSLAWIDAHPDQPWMLASHLFDPHLNYEADASTRGKFTRQFEAASNLGLPIQHLSQLRANASRLAPVDVALVRAAYDEEIAFVDAQLGRLRSELEQRGLLDNTVIVLTSDHGEELFEHGGFEHGHALWEPLLHVPLIVWGPGVFPGRESLAVSIVDIAPTVLSAVGATVPIGLEGHSLWAAACGRGEPDERMVYAESILYGPQLKAGLQLPLKVLLDVDNDRRRIYHLGDDPGETQNAARDHAKASQAMTQQARKHFAEQAAESADNPVAVPLRTRDLLKKLGYIGD